MKKKKKNKKKLLKKARGIIKKKSIKKVRRRVVKKFKKKILRKKISKYSRKKRNLRKAKPKIRKSNKKKIKFIKKKNKKNKKQIIKKILRKRIKKKLKIKRNPKFKISLLDKFGSYIKNQFVDFFGLKSYFQSKIIIWKDNRAKTLIKINKQQAAKIKREIDLLKNKNLRELSELKKQKFQFSRQLLKEKKIELRYLEREQKALEKRIILEQKNLQRKLDLQLKDHKRQEKEKIYELRNQLKLAEDRLKVFRERLQDIKLKRRKAKLLELEAHRKTREEARAILDAEKRENEIKQQVVERLEKYSRNMKSIVFQVNKRYLIRKRAPLVFIDNIAENGECFIKNQDTPDDDYLFLLYIKGENASERLRNEINLEDKTEASEIKVFNPKNVFEASDYMIDRLAALFEKERLAKKN
jgi:hypothetical protein